MKICNECNIEKDFSLFYKRKDNKDGYRNNCKSCHNIKTRITCIKFSQKDSSKLKKKEYNKKFWSNNKEILKPLNRDRYYKNQAYNLEQKRIYYIFNKNEIIKRNVEYSKLKLSIDPMFKFKHNLRSNLKSTLLNKGWKKKCKTESMLGIKINDFLIYIESKFESWMNWDNHGIYDGNLNSGWDLDHIIPLSSATTEEELILLNHYTNLHPLCSVINRNIKRDKTDYYN